LTQFPDESTFVDLKKMSDVGVDFAHIKICSRRMTVCDSSLDIKANLITAGVLFETAFCALGERGVVLQVHQ